MSYPVVKYHSPTWALLVNAGYITMCVDEEGFALMLFIGKNAWQKHDR